MKQPDYLNTKANVILYHADSIENKSEFEIFGKHLRLQGTGTAFVYLEDYQNTQVYIDVLANSNVQLYMIYKTSKPSEYDIRFHLENHAVLNLFSLTRNIEIVNLKIHRQFHIENNARLNNTKALINMGFTTLEDEVHLDSPNATVNIELLNIGAYNDKFVVTQDIYHNAKSTTSNINNSLISHANSELDYSVSGRIAKGNEFSVCRQQNKGIILDENGVIQVLPKLYIDEYNVEASHGAAIGQMDDEQMYYLQSRGLSEQEARSLIISGYTKPFVSAIEDEDIRALVERQIKKRINEANIV